MANVSVFTLEEFKRCIKAGFGFISGYKLGEGYVLGEIEEKRGKSADPEAWQLGYDLSVKRNPYGYNQGQGQGQTGQAGSSSSEMAIAVPVKTAIATLVAVAVVSTIVARKKGRSERCQP